VILFVLVTVEAACFSRLQSWRLFNRVFAVGLIAAVRGCNYSHAHKQRNQADYSKQRIDPMMSRLRNASWAAPGA
jgi:hypothetical protein